MAYEYLLRYAEPAAPTTYYYVAASRGRSTLPGDTPASTYVPGGIQGSVNYAISLFDGIEPTISPQGSVGALTLSDPKGELDYLIGLVWDGGTLSIRRGAPGAAFSTFTEVASLTTAGLLYDMDKKQIRLRDLGWLLQSAELHGQRYGGGGAADGDAGLAGRLKPYAIGQVFNVTPVQINATALIHQVSWTPINSVDAVRDGGVALTFGTNYASYALLLAAAAPAAGHYNTCLAEGLIRLGSTTVYSLTADVKGDKTGGTYYSLRGDIAQQIVTNAGTKLSTGQVDATALAALNTYDTGATGWFWDEAVTKAEALTEIMAGAMGWWYISLTGSLVLGFLGQPFLIGAPVATLDYPGDIGAAPAMTTTYQAPRASTILAYKRNYTLQDPSQLAGSVSAADALLYSQPEQLFVSPTPAIVAAWPTAQNITVASGYTNSGDASLYATFQQGIMGYSAIPPWHTRERWILTAPVDPYAFAAYIGKVVEVTNFPRYSWGSSSQFVLVGIEFASSLYVTLHLWR